MKKYTHEESFIFHNEAEGLASVVKSCIVYIEEQNDFLGVPVNILSKVKWTITELLINGAKHSGSKQSRLILKFSESSLYIEKEDEGNPLQLEVNNGTQHMLWPVQKNMLNMHFEIYRNGMDSLHVYTENENTAFFKVQEAQDEEMPLLLTHMSEHFGLMIIAKASDHFSYVLDTDSGKNIFSVRFEYDK